jgi:Lon protease-like protein
MSQDPSLPQSFTGVVRLFPLPNLVLFPSVMQPLHVFEPRYRQMTADALAGDRLLALALLRPGWEGNYEGRPALYEVVCVGKIIADQRQDDGRYNLLVRGLSRARIAEELPGPTPYRRARVELLPEVSPDDPKQERELRRVLVQRAPGWFPTAGAIREQLVKLLEGDLPLGALCDIVAFALPLPVEAKQRLLEEPDVAGRARRLLRHLKPAKERPFPPGFSAN